MTPTQRTQRTRRIRRDEMLSLIALELNKAEEDFTDEESGEETPTIEGYAAAIARRICPVAAGRDARGPLSGPSRDLTPTAERVRRMRRDEVLASAAREIDRVSKRYAPGDETGEETPTIEWYAAAVARHMRSVATDDTKDLS